MRSMVSQSPPVVCVVHPGWNAYTETFITAHIERLPAKVHVLRGDWFYNPNSTRLLSTPFFYMLKILRFASGQQRSFSRSVRIIVTKIELLALKRFLRQRTINVVLAEYGPMGVHIMKACQKAGIPLVVHFHGNDAYDHGTLQRYEKQYRRLFAIAKAIIVVSKDMEQQLVTLGAPQDKLVYNPCGADMSLFTPGDPAKNPPLFVAAGRFVDKKAPHLTLVAFHRMLESCPTARLMMIGDGMLSEPCRQLARALGIEQAVEFAGALPHSEVAAVMRRARAFVQHSLQTSNGDSEGTPVAVLEASASGLPVVSTRHGGIKDVILDGKTGLLVDEYDVAAMACHMATLAQHAELAGELGHRGRMHVTTHFSLEKSIERLWRCIQSCVDTDR